MSKTYTSKFDSVWTWKELPFSSFFGEEPAFAWHRKYSEDSLHDVWATTEKHADQFDRLAANVPEQARTYVVHAWNTALFAAD